MSGIVTASYLPSIVIMKCPSSNKYPLKPNIYLFFKYLFYFNIIHFQNQEVEVGTILLTQVQITFGFDQLL